MAPMAGDSRSRLLILLLALSLLPLHLARPVPVPVPVPKGRVYQLGNPVQIWANKVGPLNNPSETYSYYDMPFCQPDPLVKKESLAEFLTGDRLTNTLYKLNFGINEELQVVCVKNMSVSELVKFRDAIKRNYYYQMYLDDMPFWGLIGRVENPTAFSNGTGPSYFLYNKLEMDIRCYRDQVIDIHAYSNPRNLVNITADKEMELSFCYQITWKESADPRKKELSAESNTFYLSESAKVDLFHINYSHIGAFLLGILIVSGFALTIQRDIHKYGDAQDESAPGWKNICGDLFRYPSHKKMFCAVLGAGTQLLVLSILFLAHIGALDPFNHGENYRALIGYFVSTSFTAGNISSLVYFQLGGTELTEIVVLTGILFNGPLLLIFAVLNTVAIFYKATTAMPFIAITVMGVAIALILFTGGFIGYLFECTFRAPCATRENTRMIPPLPWYKRALPLIFIAGLAQLLAINVELQYILMGLWSLNPYAAMRSFLPSMLVKLVLLTAVLSTGMTYYQLAREDYRWWWRSVLCGSSPSILVFVYSFYFYARSRMSGLLQLCFYFGYTACMCYALFLILGAVSFYASLLLVCYLCRRVKVE